MRQQHGAEFIGKNDKVIALVLTLAVGVFYVLMSVVNEGIVDTADGILHYQFARFMFDHPELAFDHWAKPVFTILASVPAQMGLVGVRLMNVVLVILTAWLSYRSAVKLEYSHAFLAPLFVGIGNSITNVVLAGLTEPLFMFSLAGVIYLTVSGQWIRMYILLGCMVLIRPEAIVAIPVFVVLGIARGEWLKVLHVLWVPLLFSVSGYFVADHSILWVIAGNPYDSWEGAYGSGTWLHYFREWYRISTYTVLILGTIGIAAVLRDRRNWREKAAIWFVGIGIVSLHVLLWKFGKMGSAGLLRTMVTCLPALGLAAVGALNLIPARTVSYSAIAVMLIFGIEFVNANRFPLGVSRRELAAKEMARLLSEKVDADERLIAYQFATTAYYLDIDPFDDERTKRLWIVDNDTPSLSLNDGDILIWDNITGNNEGGVRYESLWGDPYIIPLDTVENPDALLISFRVAKPDQ